MSPLGQHPYASFVHLVHKPARYLGGEFGTTRKDWTQVETRVCLAFPDVYDIGMSHLGYKILYQIFNADPRALAERCYAPWVDMQNELRARGLPLVSLESARPLSDFDVVGFSLQFELTYTNVLAMLDLGGIPLRSAQRREADPLVIAGGPTATHPEPVSVFFDAILVGDGEERALDVALLWSELRARGVPRRERLRALADLGGVYVPSLYATRIDAETGFEVVAEPLDRVPLPVERAMVADLARFPFPDSGPTGGPEAIFDRMSIEIARGCTEGCRFCQAGMIYRPVRERDPEQIVETVVRAVRKTGYDEVSLTSLSTADHSCIAPLIKKVTDKLVPERVSLGVSSLRAYGLEENVLDDMQQVRASGVTFAPEAGSQRMRDVINKNVTEVQLMTTAERVFSRGWSAMKLYFMIGLPTEDESDVREIARVGCRARALGKRIKREMKAGGAPKVTVSVSTHVPKPHTPFQWCAMDPPEAIREKQGWLQQEARSAGIDLRLHDCDTSWLEGVFARGDRALGNVIERAYRTGARFDSWEDHKRMEVWEAAFAAEGIEVAKYLGTIPVTARLPWDHIDVGLEDGFLLREYRKALANRLSPPCGKAAGMFVHHTNLADARSDTRKLVCYDCGIACDLGAMRNDRITALSKLEAERPHEPAPRVRASRTNRPPAAFTQGEPSRYRFAFTKTGASAFLSHLDLIRELPRAFRRLALPVRYTTGFHPKPDMSFAPALSLGVASLSELVDVKIVAELDPSTLLEALSEASPEGLRYTAAVALGFHDLAITRVVDGARYAVAIPRGALREVGGDSWLKQQIARLGEARELRLLRRIDGVGKWIDIKHFLRDVELASPLAADALARAGFVGDLVPVLVDTVIRGSGAVKIAEVVEAIACAPEGGERRGGSAALPFGAVRVQLGAWAADGTLISPLDLPSLRRPRASDAAGAQPLDA